MRSFPSALTKAGQGPDAEVALHEAARLAAVAKDDVVAAKAWTELVKVVGFVEGRVDEGLELVKVAEVAIQRADADADIGADFAYNVGSVHYGKGTFDKARAAFEKALELQTKRYGENSAGAVGRTVNSIGGCLLGLGDIAGARKAFERALAIDDKVLGPNHPDAALALSNLGAVAQKQGDLEAATKSASVRSRSSRRCRVATASTSRSPSTTSVASRSPASTSRRRTIS